MELLAPVGGMEQLKAALRFGADAVYGGMKSYGLRAFASNFDLDALAKATAMAHACNARFYVTMNALLTDRELPGFIKNAQDALEAGVDAAIVSDFGAALLLRERVPSLALHISTQANVMNAPTARHLFQAAGARRIILSRELSMQDIRSMRDALPSGLELEAFAHGAMCVAYSGRCLLSAALTGRNGNRGACAQPCRWGYHLVEEERPGKYMPIFEDERGTYLFSAYDLCMLPYLSEFRDAGITSIKIEGRMKTAYYVATVVSAYRRALDVLEMDGEAAYRAIIPELLGELNKASHRPSGTGFYFDMPDPPAGADGFSQEMEYVGDVLENSMAGDPALLRLKNRFYVGDTLEILSPKGVTSFTARGLTLADTGEAVNTAGAAGTLLRMPLPVNVEAGDILRGPNRNHRQNASS